MSEHATPGRAPEALSAEALMKKYNLPSGTNDDAIARVLARLSDLPVSGTPPPSGGEKPKSPGGKSGVGSPSSRRGSKSPAVAASSRRNAMHFTGGGAAIARVAWTPASPEPGTPIGDPLELLRESYADPNSDPSDADAHARAVVAAARASGAPSSPPCTPPSPAPPPRAPSPTSVARSRPPPSRSPPRSAWERWANSSTRRRRPIDAPRCSSENSRPRAGDRGAQG